MLFDEFRECEMKELIYLFNILFDIHEYEKCLSIINVMTEKTDKSFFHLDKHLRNKFAHCIKTMIHSKQLRYTHMKLRYEIDNEKLKKEKKENQQRTITEDKLEMGGESRKQISEKERLKICLDFFRTELSEERKKLIDYCEEKLNFIDAYIFNSFPSELKEISQCEEKVFYYKLKADICRYKLDFEENEEERKKTLDKCDYLYINGIELARQWEMNNALLLAIQCNYCVFLYEVKGEKNEAIEYLSIVLERINEVISKEGEIEFERMKGKEYMKVLNLIKQNIFIWSNDTSEYKVAQNKQEEFY